MNNYNKLIKQILDLDPQVRFVGVANNKGELVTEVQKDNVEPLLKEEQVKMSVHYALQKKRLYTILAYKIGHEKFSITEFGRVTMISIPTNFDELFLISTEPRTDYFKIIDFVCNALDSQT